MMDPLIVFLCEETISDDDNRVRIVRTYLHHVPEMTLSMVALTYPDDD